MTLQDYPTSFHEDNDDIQDIRSHPSAIATITNSAEEMDYSNPTVKLNIMDWSTDMPGQRAGYDDFTAIDWIHEYTVEQMRQRILRSHGGFGTHLKLLVDASQAWIVLIFTGIVTGFIAATIDIASIWLADLKHGFCRPAFYLSHSACCWGLQSTEQCLDWITWAQTIDLSSSGPVYVAQYIMFIILSISFAGVSSFLTVKYAMYARQSGIPEIKTILGGFVIQHFMGGWTLVVKSFGLCFSVASGLWLGKEGPLVHVACCCANLLMRAFPSIDHNEARKREILSAAAAAGISVAFGSPIGGVLFSLEQVSYYFPDKTMWQSFVCAMVAAVTLQFMNPFRTGKLVLYQATFSRSWHDFELVPFCVLGIIGGMSGALFIKLNLAMAKWRKHSRLSRFPITEVAFIALASALINYPNIFMRMQASELVSNLFQECRSQNDDVLGICQNGKIAGPVSLLVLAASLGMLLSSVTFGLSLPAGVLLPSMAVGALYGRALGMLIQVWQRKNPTSWMSVSCEPDVECITPSVYAIVGAASALGGVTRMTVSVVVIMFELTGALTYVLPIMIAVLVSKWVGDAFDRKGIYESWIDFKEYPFLDNRDDAVPDLLISRVMTNIDDLTVIEATGYTLASLEDLIYSQPYKGFPVITNSRDLVLLGYISRSELRSALRHYQTIPKTTECYFTNIPYLQSTASNSIDMRPYMDLVPITLPARSSLMLATSLFQTLGLRYLIFAHHGKLQGLLTKKDAWFILNSSKDDLNIAHTSYDRYSNGVNHVADEREDI